MLSRRHQATEESLGLKPLVPLELMEPGVWVEKGLLAPRASAAPNASFLFSGPVEAWKSARRLVLG
ncbi:hypothetical protein EBT23_03695 [bacterium]|nr:hypothetical protein [bacterium]